MSDHERGCQGREYTCTCGYDAARDARIAELEAENAGLKERLLRFVEENERMSSALASFERDNADLRSGEYLVRVIEERERLRKALEFYAEEKNYHPEMFTLECGCCSSWWDEKIGREGDTGYVARKALEAKP